MVSADDRYTIPGSGGVLRNKLGLTTREDVDWAMNHAASAEWAVIRTESVPDRLDLDHLRSVHRRLFSPVLEWAGELRRLGDEVKAEGTSFAYARSQFFERGLTDIFGQLEREDYLRGLSADEFASKLADRWGYLTMTHPFRDGNTRTQSIYVHQVAERAGHPILWSGMDVETLRDLRLRAAAGREGPLAEYLRAHLGEPGVEDSPLALSSRELRAATFPNAPGAWAARTEELERPRGSTPRLGRSGDLER